MKLSIMRRGIAGLFAILWMTGLLSACNTMEGAGQDIERAGEEIQEEAR